MYGSKDVVGNIMVLRQHKQAERIFGKGRTAFMRFVPDEPTDPLKDEAKKEDDEAKRKFDAERQRADQAEANVRKMKQAQDQLRSTNEAISMQVSQANQRLESLEQELAAAKAEAAKGGIVTLNADDYEGGDKALVQSINSLQASLNAQQEAHKAEIELLKQKAIGYEAEERKRQAQAAKDASYNRLLTRLDGKYSPQCRNAAVAAFQEKWANGDVPKDNAAEATLILDECYKGVQEDLDKKKKKKPGFTPDPGSGGGRPGGSFDSHNTKRGDRSLAEVIAESKGKAIQPA